MSASIFTFVRHSQKTSGKVFEDQTTTPSTSGLSSNGKIRAAVFGKHVLTGRIITAAYATESMRTKETLEAAFSEVGITVPIFQPKLGSDELLCLPFSDDNEEEAQEYGRIFQENLD